MRRRARDRKVLEPWNHQIWLDRAYAALFGLAFGVLGLAALVLAGTSLVDLLTRSEPAVHTYALMFLPMELVILLFSSVAVFGIVRMMLREESEGFAWAGVWVVLLWLIPTALVVTWYLPLPAAVALAGFWRAARGTW